MSEDAARPLTPVEHTSVEELRRRLYSPAATPEDHARYRAAVDAPRAAPIPTPVPTSTQEAPTARAPATEAASADIPPRPSRRRRLALPIAVGTVAIAAATIAAQHAPAPRHPPQQSQAIRMEVIHSPGPVPPTPVSEDETARVEFLRNLEAGRAADITGFLATHPLSGGAAPRHLLERQGSGPGTVALDGLGTEVARGQATVFLVTEFAGWAGWRAYDPGPAYEGSEHVQLEAIRAGLQEGGILTAGTVAYASGDRPLQLRVDVPAGVRWGVAVVISD